MSKYKLEIDDYYELLSLHKAILEAKFHENPYDKYVCSSPMIAKIENEIVEILIAIDSEKNKEKGEQWKEWRKLEGKNYFRQCALKNAISNKEWKYLSHKEKVNLCNDLLSPFIASNNEIEVFIDEVDRKVL